MEIPDYSATLSPEPIKHHPLLPNSIRMIIIGPSGSGKTQLLIDMIMRHMKWDKLYLVAPSVDDQRYYKVLKDFNERILEIKGEDGIDFITDISEAPQVDNLDASINNLIAYDDVMLDKQTNPAAIFSRGRHKNADIIYATQRYTQIPKVVRDNCNLLCVFNGVDTHTLRNIWQTWCADMDYNTYTHYFNYARALKYGFITINIHDPTTRYRVGLSKIYNLST